jgi:SAM-dependent methyltransferase
MIMREEQIERLKDMRTSIDDIWFLHYYPYHKSLKLALVKNARGRLLDIGCGNKPYQSTVAPYIDEYIGCDIVQSSKNCVDILSPANNIPLDAESFDTVISTQTIEHVEDHQGLINEAYRLLKTGGYLILSGPMYWPLHEEPYDFFRFTKYGFKYILEKAGFSIVNIEANGGKWAVAGQAFLHALYPQINNVSGIKGKTARALLKSIGGIKGINRFFLYLDGKGTDYSNTMNYVIVAKK